MSNWDSAPNNQIPISRYGIQNGCCNVLNINAVLKQSIQYAAKILHSGWSTFE